MNELILIQGKHSYKYLFVSLVKDLDMNYYQAASCATIAHNKGKCSIKEGDVMDLKEMQDLLSKRKINTEIV